ncbi:hypothetical protein KM1_210450 [Entamoeba histolytica HM-3:IMSS]|uniref:Uncharacterized protein n=4 Tax=Entamoeba histolytica TaxID=5759 RepID=C4M2M8_ENTH1|nr:hypothetical protein EHI_005930 [Entamoeba histolytica HM-1:IMSS]EAL48029.1 hypothetical protein EHI_005930 [Entamoeba histolytica HM-1:IMSS]EMS11849.1 hypothetical protein KM1_210450 [Entamoeba histolytica HM-3:IMSS]ENY63998.1 hypothetical protein EHI7A_178800 [Entamoeba histolytica HM-1:IMSS-A]GAT95535.1 hypothetical protein CL6EHI_005930 [Entamoeba histolytica]|eukprot:XP_653417.1 hypothetical protein EHI_005930 [Entamoeba histolytica HM-1:IMSS]
MNRKRVVTVNDIIYQNSLNTYYRNITQWINNHLTHSTILITPCEYNKIPQLKDFLNLLNQTNSFSLKMCPLNNSFNSQNSCSFDSMKEWIIISSQMHSLFGNDWKRSYLFCYCEITVEQLISLVLEYAKCAKMPLILAMPQNQITEIQTSSKNITPFRHTISFLQDNISNNIL